MTNDKCIIILSEKSSGSSACQDLLATLSDFRHVATTRHFENETLYWTKAASILNRPQHKMVDSEVPLKKEKAKADLLTLLHDNLDDFVPPPDDETLIREGWRALCKKFSPIFIEKSPHHLCQWSAVELILQCMQDLDTVDFLLIGLVRNPMDTIYSQYKRWKSPPDKVEKQWMVAYQNLLKLKDIVPNDLVVLRYEDMVSSMRYLAPVFAFCGIVQDITDQTFLHGKSIQKWKKDLHFGFSLSTKTIELAEKFGYQENELVNYHKQLLWPVRKGLSRKAYMAARSLRFLKRRIFKA